LQEFVVSAAGVELLKKAIRAGIESALPPLPDECKPAIAKELTDVLWYALVGLDRCGVSASEAFEQLRTKLQARKEAGTLAATEKRDES
jgi:phosphoribosyl-ATP pyrophosphohydrolase